jgi:hypothetical protein
MRAEHIGRHILVVALAAVSGCSLAACAVLPPVGAQLADSSPPTAPEYLTEGPAADEYLATITSIPEPLPAGETYPAGLPATFVPDDGVLETGSARNQAWFTWLCAWETEYVDSVGDEERRAEAEIMIARWAEMDFYRNVIDDHDKGWIEDVLEPMFLGDSSGVKTELAQSCAAYPTVATG